MGRIKIIGTLTFIFLNALLILSCSKQEAAKNSGFIKLKIDGGELNMTYLAQMDEKESGTWNLNALTDGSGSDLSGRKSFTVNVRDLENGMLKEREYKLDNGSGAISAVFTEHFSNPIDNRHWTASSLSALAEDSFTINFTSITADRAEGTFSGTLLVSSKGNIQKFRKITEGEFSLSIR